MGILNATPDSFHSESRTPEVQMAVDRAGEMLRLGATIIDIGGQSTRPGAAMVAATEEMQRAVPIVEAVVKALPQAIVSIDTFYADVAKEAVKAGASIVNDVSAASIDPDLLRIVAELQVPYVLMHMNGIPAGPHTVKEYTNVSREVIYWLSEKMVSLRLAGVADIIVDPGFGFGKNAADNAKLMQELDHFEVLSAPVMVGISRKKMIQNIAHTDASGALNATTSAHTVALMRGASILRVHDVKEAVEAVEIVQAFSIS